MANPYFRLIHCVEVPEMIEVNSVEVAPDFELVLTFASGERRRFDMRPYLHYPVFRRLENPGFFSLARVDYGAWQRRGNL